MTDRFTWSAGQFRITRPRGEKFAWGAGDFKVVAVPDQKYSDDEPRDEHGRWGDGGGVTWYHGTSEELKPGDVLTPGHEVRHGENDKVWVSDNAYQASKYGAFVYEVHPHEEPVGRQKANHEFSTVGAHVVGTVAESVIREHSNQMAQEAADYDRRRRKDVKYSADQPRDDHGRFGEGSTFYHGSPTAGLTAVAARIDARQFDNATSQLGAFVTDDPKYAAQYAGKTGTVYEAAVVLQNPYHMSYSEFNYFQSPDKDADGKSLPGEQWEARAAALKDEAIALRARLESDGYDGIVVRGSGMRPTEVASFSDIPLTEKKEAKYSADEPRDEHGRWGDGGSSVFAPEVEASLRGRLAAFASAGGTIQVVHQPGDNQDHGKAANALWDEAEASKIPGNHPSENDTRPDTYLYHSLQDGIETHFGLVVARDGAGKLVGALSYARNGDDLTVHHVGVYNGPPGTGVALEAAVAKLTTGRVVGYPHAESLGWHTGMGRTVTENHGYLTSTWSKEQAREVAAFGADKVI